MTYAYIEERCSCNAKFKVPVLAPGTENLWESAVAQLDRWRELHEHEFEPVPADPPTVVESGSSHERVGDEVGVADRVPAGFARVEAFA